MVCLGGAILPAYDPLLDSSIRHVLVRHEQGAGHMAEGYAHATGLPGVAIVTSGPAATNMVTPLADALLTLFRWFVSPDSRKKALLGSDAFQECDTTGITMAVTKHNFLVTEASEIPQVIHDAFHIATTGRPGPVLVDIPKDLVDANNPVSHFDDYEPSGHDLPVGYSPIQAPDHASVLEAAKLILQSTRPIIYSGGGILKSAQAAEQLRELAELLDVHVVTTLMNRGGFPDDHPLALGMPGMHGNYTAVTAIQESDLLITLGARFDDRVKGKVDAFAPDAKVIHADIDPAEFNKVRSADVSIQGDVGQTITELIKALKELSETQDHPDRSAWEVTDQWMERTFPIGI